MTKRMIFEIPDCGSFAVSTGQPFTLKVDRKGRKVVVFDKPPEKGHVISISYVVKK